jgi:hypothetical protein
MDSQRLPVDKVSRCTAVSLRDSFGSVKDNPKATRAYAWMHGLDDTKAKRHVAVLEVPPIDSPQAAVKAVIVYEYKQQKK